MVVYMQLFDADMSSKPEDMCRARFLRSSRAANCSAGTFVCGLVCAEMKKSTVYMVDVKLDVCGVVRESQLRVWGREGSRGPL